MKNLWTERWKKVFIWFSCYIGFTAFAIVGGYTIVKSENEELKKTTKTAFITCLIFACISAFLSLFSNIAGMSDNYYSSAAYDFYSIASSLVNIGKIVVYAIFIILELIKKDDTEPTAE